MHESDCVDAVAESISKANECPLTYVQLPRFVRENEVDKTFSSPQSTALGSV